MRKLSLPLFSVIAVMTLISLASCRSNRVITVAGISNSIAPKGWQLTWSEEFNGKDINWDVWSKCPRVNHIDWCNTMSDREDLYAVRDGNLILRGINNPDTKSDPAKFLTGGIWTKEKVSFEPDYYIEVKAKLQGAKGAWPAIWMLPSDPNVEWPHGGEIDIMERLSFEDGAYQTVHSNYTDNMGRVGHPKATLKSPIKPDDYNVYGVAVTPDSVKFYINGVPTLNYPKFENGKHGQFPYHTPMFLILDMQLGGKWVGDVNPKDLPVEMLVDWVRFYQPKR